MMKYDIINIVSSNYLLPDAITRTNVVFLSMMSFGIQLRLISLEMLNSSINKINLNIVCLKHSYIIQGLMSWLVS